MSWKENRTQKRERAEIERLRQIKKNEVLSRILDKRLFNEAFMEALLIASIDTASRSADRLSKRIFWLNILLLIIGVLGLFVAAYGVFINK